MAKYRHRTFEMFDFREEAMSALATKPTPSAPESDEAESWTFQQLAASREAIVIHVTFKSPKRFGSEDLPELREDFSRLADCLVNDSRVLLDFEGLQTFCSGCIDALAQFNRRLQSKGSRIALCSLEAAVRDSFFPNRKSIESGS